MFSFLSSMPCKICFLQEVHLRDQVDVGVFSEEWGKGEAFWSVGGVHSSGVGIILGDRGLEVEDHIRVVQGRVLRVDFVWGGTKILSSVRVRPCDTRPARGGVPGARKGMRD